MLERRRQPWCPRWWLVWSSDGWCVACRLYLQWQTVWQMVTGGRQGSHQQLPGPHCGSGGSPQQLPPAQVSCPTVRSSCRPSPVPQCQHTRRGRRQEAGSCPPSLRWCTCVLGCTVCAGIAVGCPPLRQMALSTLTDGRRPPNGLSEPRAARWWEGNTALCRRHRVTLQIVWSLSDGLQYGEESAFTPNPPVSYFTHL